MGINSLFPTFYYQYQGINRLLSSGQFIKSNIMSNAVEISIQGRSLQMESENVCFNYYLVFDKMSTSRISNLLDINISVYCLEQLFIFFMFIGKGKTKTLLNCITVKLISENATVTC